jgi:hypothetical protein
MRGFVVMMMVAAALTACKRNPPPVSAQTPGAAMPQAQGGAVKGKILERLEAPPYTYFRLQIGDKEQWAAVPENALKVGEEVSLANPMEMNNFESKTLKRTFPSVLFANIATGEAPAPTTSNANVAKQHTMTGKGPDVGDINTPKATGAEARTVAEAHAQKDKLKEKTVAIRGKVVKFNAEILGRNWIHLRDGSGNPDKGDNDITITTKETAAIGDTLTIRGTLRLNKDFGSGYSYPVIIEDAKLQK